MPTVAVMPVPPAHHQRVRMCTLHRPDPNALRYGKNESGKAGEWTAEVWAITNVPLSKSKVVPWLVQECKHLPNNYIKGTGLPQ